ncbi:unnamed protein product [Adineta steineri]|uniref:Uncharacterized protein n=1 Tax=Adineta steineri TaxID=433720 RepID=A0A815KLL8_9BILA|nr:unnamed protein product [Adineta steineri]CAF1611623.1 unnamed protein product [Adineta steineri]
MYQRDGTWLSNDFMVDPVSLALTFTQLAIVKDWILSNTIKRFPILAESECETLITDADSFIPNGRLIMNESAEVSCLAIE